MRHDILYGVFVVLFPIYTTLPFAARRRDAGLSGFSILSSYRETNKYLHFYVQPTTTKKIVKETANSFLVLHLITFG